MWGGQDVITVGIRSHSSDAPTQAKGSQDEGRRTQDEQLRFVSFPFVSGRSKNDDVVVVLLLAIAFTKLANNFSLPLANGIERTSRASWSGKFEKITARECQKIFEKSANEREINQRKGIIVRIMWGILLPLAALLALVSNGAAIRCYVCDSSDNPSCADLGSNSSIVAEECTLDKMKSLDTWLFDLNKFSYFDNGANKSPLMNCQKVVAKDPDTRKVVTARFCQLDTGDSDACEILRTKLRIPSPEEREQRNRNQNKRRKGHGQDAEEDDEISAEDAFFCGICKSHRCNGAAAVTLSLATILAMIALQLGC